MAGRRQFDEDETLERALMCFWRNGCEGASLRDLEAATGLNKSSLYNAYGSKAGLLERCLERFSSRYTSEIFAALGQRDIKAAIDAFTGALARRFERKDIPPGCLATMAAMEEGGAGNEISQSVDREMAGLKRRLFLRFEQAVSDGQLPADTDSDALASLFLALTRGVAVLHRGSSDHASIASALKAAGALINNPPRKDN